MVLTSTFSTTCVPNEQTLVEHVMVLFSDPLNLVKTKSNAIFTKIANCEE